MKMKQYCVLLLLLICSISNIYFCSCSEAEKKNHHKNSKNHISKSKSHKFKKEKLQAEAEINFEDDFNNEDNSEENLFMELKNKNRKIKIKNKIRSKNLSQNKNKNKFHKVKLEAEAETETDYEIQEENKNKENDMSYLSEKSSVSETETETESLNTEEEGKPSAVIKKIKKAAKVAKKKRVADPNDMILQPEEKLDVLMTDYMMISSPQFKNRQKFPPLELPDGKTALINVDKDYFRINDFAVVSPNGPPTNKHFWFRMSGRNLYYSTNKEDINVLGAIRITNIMDVKEGELASELTRYCFRIFDQNKMKWKLCAPNISRKNLWICAIRKILNIKTDLCKKAKLANTEVTVLTKRVTQPIILVSQANKMCNEDWNYLKRGSDWECTCSEGKEQSPINLPKKEDAINSPVRPVFQYDEVPKERVITTNEGISKTQRLRIVYEDTTLKIKNAEFGKVVTLDGAEYSATEIIFHTPAEHTVNGKVYPMEMQIIHQGLTQGDIGKQVILSFLFDKKPGSYNKFIDDIDFFNLPNPVFKSKEIGNNIYIPKIFYNTKDQDLPIMQDFSFYTYQGSLTQPPCTERTIHYVASEIIPLGSTALTLFKEATRIPDKMDSMGNLIVNTNPSINSRKIQALNGRKVYHYTGMGTCKIPGVKRRIKKKSHYEKIVTPAVKYFYVPSEIPSRLPGAIVVSEEEAKGKI